MGKWQFLENKNVRTEEENSLEEQRKLKTETEEKYN